MRCTESANLEFGNANGLCLKCVEHATLLWGKRSGTIMKYDIGRTPFTLKSRDSRLQYAFFFAALKVLH